MRKHYTPALSLRCRRSSNWLFSHLIDRCEYKLSWSAPTSSTAATVNQGTCPAGSSNKWICLEGKRLNLAITLFQYRSEPGNIPAAKQNVAVPAELFLNFNYLSFKSYVVVVIISSSNISIVVVVIVVVVVVAVVVVWENKSVIRFRRNDLLIIGAVTAVCLLFLAILVPDARNHMVSISQVESPCGDREPKNGVDQPYRASKGCLVHIQASLLSNSPTGTRWQLFHSSCFLLQSTVYYSFCTVAYIRRVWLL